MPVAHIEPIAGPTIATDPLAVTAALCAHLEALPGSAGVRVVKPLLDVEDQFRTWSIVVKKTRIVSTRARNVQCGNQSLEKEAAATSQPDYITDGDRVISLAGMCDFQNPSNRRRG